jgi:hypothetical protein
MKSLILLFFITLPLIPFAQRVITLSVNQPPEFGFSVSKQDTTIDKGRSVVLGTDLVVFGGSGEYEYNWSPTATLDDSTSINPLATPLDTTTYLLTVTDKFGCSFSVNYTVKARNPLVGNELLPSQQTLQAVLFPNPNDGKFKVKLTGNPSEKIELSIVDAAGRIVKNHTILNFTGEHTETLQVSIVSGIYSLKIVSDTEMLTRQFIIN